ncbi:MAG: chromosome segregation protein SMC [Methylococcales bacterium]|nr:chromosome segregation protein SMC [Methylococcales bacterium]
MDPTTVLFPSDLVGIVGPNGCGKSNTIDAVRWVMGESSAKNLRGESMTDVIFNGSSARKPVGQCSVELIFDNSDGGAGGEYTTFSEISIRRVVTRYAISTYYLNGTKCRRRDITDLFAGTGLGPRSYAIIEQGMISRLIESKPEELRVFLEEAAGISKYKDRRKETATRMRHTTENLERLTDVKDEVEKQLAHLKRQAATAERYQNLKEEERQVELELMSLRWRNLDEDATAKQRQIEERNNRLEEGIMQQRKVEADIDAFREEHIGVTDHFNQVQSQFYQVGGEITRLEQSVGHIKERKQQLMNDLDETARQRNELVLHQEQDVAKCHELTEQLAEDEPELEMMAEQEESFNDQLQEAEHQQQELQGKWEEYNAQLSAPSEKSQVERTKINHLEQHVEQLKQRIMKATDELERLGDGQLVVEIESLSDQANHWQINYDSELEQVTELKDEVTQLRAKLKEDGVLLDEKKLSLQQLLGKKASLEALQQAAKSDSDESMQSWLVSQQLHDRDKLAQVIQVEAGFEAAVETVLGDYLEAISCEALTEYQSALAEIEQGSVLLYDPKNTRPTAGPNRHPLLLDKVTCPWDVASLMRGVYLADDLALAFHIQADLNSDESVITPEGVWLGAQWVRVAKAGSEVTGVIAREQALRDMVGQEAGLSDAVTALIDEQEAINDVVLDKELERDDHQDMANQAQKNLSEFQTKLSSKQTRLEHIYQRRDELAEEIAEIEEQVAEENEQILVAREVLHESLLQMEDLSAERETLLQTREQCKESVAEFKAQARHVHEQKQAVALKVESMKAQFSSTRDNLNRLKDQVEGVIERREMLSEQLEEAATPQIELAEQLEEQLEQKVVLEETLNDARAAVDQVDQTIRGLEKGRHQSEQSVLELRTKMDEVRLAYEGVVVRRQTIQEAMAETFAEVDGILNELAEDADEGVWKRRLDE